MYRPKISVYIAVSIDGFIARKDGALDWLERVHHGAEDYGFSRFLQTIDAVIMGRKTYEVARSAPESEWPYFQKRLLVLSRTLNSVDRGGELFSGDVKTLVRRLHEEGITHIWVDGGETIGQFLAEKLIDTMILSVIPVLLGSGIRLFSQEVQELSCSFSSVKSYPSGLVQLCYTMV